jgi:hypothetical protein
MSARLSEAPQETPGGTPLSFVRAVERLLRPFVRAMIAHGLTYTQLIVQLKRMYVEVAEREFTLEGRRQTDSRITLLTAVHRKDVKRLRGAQRAPFAVPMRLSLHGEMIALWRGDPEFLDADGKPRALLRQAPDGAASFDTLVERVSKDIRGRVVLDEWLRLGLARLEGELVMLNAAAFVPQDGFDDLAYYFGRNLHDHIAAAEHNLSRRGAPFLERSAYYDRLTPESVAALRTRAEALGTEALLALNREALRLVAEDKDKPSADQRINFGVYFFAAPEEPEKR